MITLNADYSLNMPNYRVIAYIIKGIEGSTHARRFTYDLERPIDDATKVGCSVFGDPIIASSVG